MAINSSPVPRVELKHSLRLERQRLYGGHFLPECAYCGEGIKDEACDMNEVLFTKGDVQGAEHLSRLLINHRCNCTLVHPGGNTSPCHSGAHTKEGQVRMIKHLIYWEGIDVVLGYIDLVEEHMKGGQATAARNLVMEVWDAM